MIRIAIVASENKAIPSGMIIQKLDQVKRETKEFELVVVEGSTESIIVEAWAGEKKIVVKKVPPSNWRRYGNAAGSLRNSAIRDASDFGVFFSIGGSLDIRDLMKQFNDVNKRYYIFKLTE